MALTGVSLQISGIMLIRTPIDGRSVGSVSRSGRLPWPR